jgi:hypothetical protein
MALVRKIMSQRAAQAVQNAINFGMDQKSNRETMFTEENLRYVKNRLANKMTSQISADTLEKTKKKESRDLKEEERRATQNAITKAHDKFSFYQTRSPVAQGKRVQAAASTTTLYTTMGNAEEVPFCANTGAGAAFAAHKFEKGTAASCPVCMQIRPTGPGGLVAEFVGDNNGWEHYMDCQYCQSLEEEQRPQKMFALTYWKDLYAFCSTSSSEVIKAHPQCDAAHDFAKKFTRFVQDQIVPVEPTAPAAGADAALAGR